MRALPATWTTPKATITLRESQFGGGLTLGVRITATNKHRDISLGLGSQSSALTPDQSKQIAAAGVDASTRRAYGTLYIPSDICDEIDAISSKLYEEMRAAREIRASRIAAIPGLAELEAAIEDRARYSREFERMMEDEYNDGVRIPRKATGNVEQLMDAYPVAAAYILADSWCDASHDVKSSAGHKALEEIISGADPTTTIADMRATWTQHNSTHD